MTRSASFLRRFFRMVCGRGRGKAKVCGCRRQGCCTFGGVSVGTRRPIFDILAGCLNSLNRSPLCAFFLALLFLPETNVSGSEKTTRESLFAFQAASGIVEVTLTLLPGLPGLAFPISCAKKPRRLNSYRQYNPTASGFYSTGPSEPLGNVRCAYGGS